MVIIFKLNLFFKLKSVLDPVLSLLSLISDLEKSDGDWERKIAKNLRRMSPTSLAVTFKHITDGKNMNLSDVFKIEYRLGNFDT